MAKLLFSLVLFLPGSYFRTPSLVNHALYLSVLEIDNRNMNSEASVNIKVFQSDFEDALKNKFKETFDFDKQGPCSGVSKKIQEYFTDHLMIEINGEKKPLEFESCEKNSDSIWLYFKLDKEGQWRDVNVKADYLMELFPTQSNVVSIYNGDQKKFLRITLENTTQSVSF